MAILEIDQLSKYFTLNPGILARILSAKRIKLIKAVDGVSFRVEAGEILGIAGESGCGKSTTCMLIARLYEPTGGVIRYKDRDISHMTKADLREFRRQAQIIFQDPYESLNPRFTTFDLVAEPLRALTVLSKAEVNARVTETLELVGLKPEEYRDRYPHQMSGGERQRVGIAQALVLNPELVIADEPLSMLDVSIRAGILDLIRDLSKRMNFTCIYVSHDLSILSNISERLMIMYLGKIMELGMTADLIQNPLHPYSRALISAVPVPDPSIKREVPNIKGEVSKPVDLPPGCRFEPRCPDSAPICRSETPLPRELSKGHWVACHLV
ncbi:MAG: ABC transporter ATP-binding protein [Deltaproteobacteria bacterium]|nr:ABC transporter ATP-binding protein [Deltaproteobacteria bacterium]MBW2121437.1 ABC transporter ATP-binding protein [Deltaproteobacteria bacterium]